MFTSAKENGSKLKRMKIMSNTKLSTLECSVQRLNNAIAKLQDIQISYQRLDKVAVKYINQTKQLNKARDNFRYAAQCMRESMSQREL